MKRLTALLAIIFLVSSIGCDSDTTTSVTPSKADPFVTGNYWIYQTTTYLPDGSIDATHTDSVAILTTRMHEGTKLIEYSDAHTEEVRNSGIWHSGPGEIWYKYPAKENDVLYTLTSVPVKVGIETFSGDISRYVSKVDDIITVPAGTFSTYRYYLDITRTNNDTVLSRRTDNFSPNIGLVKSELYITSSETPPLYIIYRKELIRYHLQK